MSRQAPPSSLSPFSYVGLVLALLWGWLVWGEVLPRFAPTGEDGA